MKEEMAVPTDDQSKRLVKLIKRLEEAQEIVASLEDNLKEAKETQRMISEDLIPTFMDEIGVSSLTLSNGDEVKTIEKITAAPLKERRAEAHAWLRKHGHGALVKNEITASFGKGEDETASAFMAELQKRGLVVAQKEAVHPMTLSAFVREQLKEGVEIPFDLLGVHQRTETQVTRKKGK